jgi:hypothetical protein
MIRPAVFREPLAGAAVPSLQPLEPPPAAPKVVREHAKTSLSGPEPLFQVGPEKPPFHFSPGLKTASTRNCKGRDKKGTELDGALFREFGDCDRSPVNEKSQ